MESDTMERKTILIAEDDEASYKFLEIILESSGFNVLRAENGEMAVDICRDHDISLVLMDIRMPGTDGLQAARMIKDINSSIPVIAQTASSGAMLEENARNAGCDGFYSKPIDRKTILGIIEKYL